MKEEKVDHIAKYCPQDYVNALLAACVFVVSPAGQFNAGRLGWLLKNHSVKKPCSWLSLLCQVRYPLDRPYYEARARS